MNQTNRAGCKDRLCCPGSSPSSPTLNHSSRYCTFLRCTIRPQKEPNRAFPLFRTLFFQFSTSTLQKTEMCYEISAQKHSHLCMGLNIQLSNYEFCWWTVFPVPCIAIVDRLLNRSLSHGSMHNIESATAQNFWARETPQCIERSFTSDFVPRVIVILNHLIKHVNPCTGLLPVLFGFLVDIVQGSSNLQINKTKN